MRQLKCLLRENICAEEAWAGSERERESCALGGSSGFPLASHLAVSGFKSIIDLAKGPPMCAHASFSQD